MSSRAGLGPRAVVWRPCSETSQLTDCRKYVPGDYCGFYV